MIDGVIRATAAAPGISPVTAVIIAHIVGGGVIYAAIITHIVIGRIVRAAIDPWQ